MAESLNMKSMQLKIDGEYIAFTEPLIGFKWSEGTEVYDGNDFFEKDHTVYSGSASFTTTFKCLPRKPKSKKRRIQKKYLKKWYKVFGGLFA